LPQSVWNRVGQTSSISLCLASRRYYDCDRCFHQNNFSVQCASDLTLQPNCLCDHGYRAYDDDLPAHAVSWPIVTYNHSDWASAQGTQSFYIYYLKNFLGFDSGFLVVDKAKSMRQLHRIDRLSRSGSTDSNRYARFSNGDKDLWHLAWMLDRAPYNLNPYVAQVAAGRNDSSQFFDSHNPKLSLASQLKLDENGRPLVLHQNWQEIKSNDITALIVADLRLLNSVPFNPDINVGFEFPRDETTLPLHFREGTRSPAPSKLLRSISSIRQAWNFPSSFAVK